MIYRKAIKCMPYFKNNVIQPDLTPRLNDVKAFLSTALIDHTIFDLGIHSLSELSGKTAGKYICLFQARLRQHFDTPVTGTATAGAATTITLAAGASAVDDFYNGCVIQITSGTGSGQYRVITDYVGSTKVATVGAAWGTNPASGSGYKLGDCDSIEAEDLNPHTNVYVTGIQITNYNMIISNNNNIYLSPNTTPMYGTDLNKSSFYYINIRLKTNSSSLVMLKNLIVESSTITNKKLDGYVEIITSTINKSYLFLSYGVFPDSGTQNITIKNSIINEIENETTFLISGATFINCLFIATYYNYTISGLNTTNFINCYINDTLEITFSLYGKTEYSDEIYLYGNIILNNYGTANYNYNWVKKYYSEILGVNKYYIDWSKIDFDAFLDIECGVSREYTINTKTYAKGNYQYYRLAFEDDKTNPDEFKAIFSDDWLLFVRRLDMEAVLCPTGTPKKISNLAFFENDGATAYDLIADSGANTIKDEYFLILAEDASNNKAVFLWYGNKLWKTIYSDAFDDTAYTILNCFQIWEADNYDDCSINFDATTTGERAYIARENSPISGSMRFNNLDNEIKED